MKFKTGLIFSLMLVVILSMGSIALAKTYTVGTSAAFPPFEYVEQDGTIVGFDIDLIKAIGDIEGFDVKVTDLSFDSLIPAVKTGNLDIIIAGMTITDKREKAVDFSKPYFVANQSIIVKDGSDQDLAVLFGDHKIGVQTGTTGDLWVTEHLKDKGILKGKISRYDKYLLVLSDLVNGNLDAVVLDTPVAEKYSKIRPVKIVGEVVTGEEYGIAVNEGNKELLNKINDGLKKVKESGKMDEIIGKYFN